MHRFVVALMLLVAAVPAAASWRIARSGRYICADGSDVRFREAPYGVSMERLGRETELSRLPSWSGFGYRGGGMTLRGRGVEGAKILTIETATGPTTECRAVPAGRVAGVVIGRVAGGGGRLPPGARLLVELRDTARADAAAPLLGRSEVRPRGNGLPLLFWLGHDAHGARPPARPALSARLLAPDGRLLMVSDGFTPLPPPGTEAVIRLVAATAAPSPPRR